MSNNINKWRYDMIGDRDNGSDDIVSVNVGEFLVGDVEDPVLYASDPLIEWQKSEIGSWVMSNCVDMPLWHRTLDQSTFSYKFIIVAKLDTKNALFYKMKWGKWE